MAIVKLSWSTKLRHFALNAYTRTCVLGSSKFRTFLSAEHLKVPCSCKLSALLASAGSWYLPITRDLFWTSQPLKAHWKPFLCIAVSNYSSGLHFCIWWLIHILHRAHISQKISQLLTQITGQSFQQQSNRLKWEGVRRWAIFLI